MLIQIFLKDKQRLQTKSRYRETCMYDYTGFCDLNGGYLYERFRWQVAISASHMKIWNMVKLKIESVWSLRKGSND